MYGTVRLAAAAAAATCRASADLRAVPTNFATAAAPPSAQPRSAEPMSARVNPRGKKGYGLTRNPWGKKGYGLTRALVVVRLSMRVALELG